MPPFIRTLLQAIVGLVVIAAVWFVAAIAISDPLRLPAPPIVFARALDLAASDEYLRHLTESLTALLFGLAPALVVGVVLGFLARGMRWILGPLVVVLAAAPVLALYPLFVLWGGLTLVPKAALIFIAAAFPVMNAIMMHASSPPPRAALPSDDNFGKIATPRHSRSAGVAMISGLRLGVILGVAALILSEFTAASRGAAFVITSAASMFETATMLAGFLLIAIPTILVIAVLQGIEEQIAG
jgi:NitT/TauT family transport system permease protein